MNRRGLIAIAVLSILGSACADDGPGEPYDGNFIVGDASDGGGPATDAEPSDAADRPDVADVGLDVPISDGGPLDADPLDATPADDGAVDGGDECEAAAVFSLTASAAVTRSGELDGQVVEIEGRLATGAQSCTDRACTPEEPCCNTCSAALLIDGVIDLVASSCASPVACTGDECRLVCQPPALGLVERFRGRWQDRGGQTPALELYEVTP